MIGAEGWSYALPDTPPMLVCGTAEQIWTSKQLKAMFVACSAYPMSIKSTQSLISVT